MPSNASQSLHALSLKEIEAIIAAVKLPPLEKWAPERTSDSFMRIAANGDWFHKGGRINRPAMVRAFSTLLVRDEAGEYFLLAPDERQKIIVEDAPFIAVDVAETEGHLVFRLNTDDLVIAGAKNPLRAAGTEDAPALYLAVRHGCEARLNRSTYLQLADIALAKGDDWRVESGGASFSLMPK